MDTEDVQPAPNIDHLLSNIGRTGLLGEASGERRLPPLSKSPPAPESSPKSRCRVEPDAAFTLKAEVGKLGGATDQRDMEAV